MAAVDQDLLGGGLDIEGWSYIKKEVAAKIADMTDRTTVLRNTFPMLIRDLQGLYNKLDNAIKVRIRPTKTSDSRANNDHIRSKKCNRYIFYW